MKTLNLSIFFTIVLLLGAIVLTAQPDPPVAEVDTTSLTKASSLEELFDLVKEMKANATFEYHRQWVEQEYNRLVREIDETYHLGPTATTPTSGQLRQTTQPTPEGYGWLNGNPQP